MFQQLTLSKPDKMKTFKKMIILLFTVVVFSGFFIPLISSYNIFADDIGRYKK
jgi:nucleoside recognition membrane protein YjiH